MTMNATVRALTDLAEVDHQLSGGEVLTDRLALALEERRAALRQAIPSKFLAAYDVVGRAGRRPVVVPLVRGAHCGGCYLRLPPQLGASVRRGQSPVCCPHCRRLLCSSAGAADSEGGNGSERTRAGGSPAMDRESSTRKRRPSRATGERKSRV
jgi:predicted  nucleic acid-binding Zn-ribbon protein